MHRLRAAVVGRNPGIRRIDDGVARREEGEEPGAEVAGVDVPGRALSGAVAESAGLVVVTAVDGYAVGRRGVDAECEFVPPGRVEGCGRQVAQAGVMPLRQRCRRVAGPVRPGVLRFGVSRVRGPVR